MNFEENLIVGILQKPTRICTIVDSIEKEFFQQSLYAAIYSLLKRFHLKRKRKQWMDAQLFEQFVENMKASPLQAKMLEFSFEIEDYPDITEETFTESYTQLLESYKRRLVEQGSIDAANSLVEGDTEKAIQQMDEALLRAGELEYDLSSPVNIITKEQHDAAIHELEEAIERRENENIDSEIGTGFQYIDDSVYFDKQHLTIIGGYAGDGKTSLAKEIAYNNLLEGKNVLFIPLEMTLQEMRTMFVCRHARTLDMNSGVRWVEILKGAHGNLTEKEDKLYREAYKDFIENPDIGTLYIWEAKRDQRKMEKIESRVRYMSSEHEIDIVIPDYLELIYPKKFYSRKRHNVTQIAEDLKALAREENVWMVVPHQISRKGREQAEKRKDNPYYIERDLGESSGIEKNADSILWIFSSEDLKFDHEARIGVMKARMGRTIEKGFTVFADFMKASIYQLGQVRTPWSVDIKDVKVEEIEEEDEEVNV